MDDGRARLGTDRARSGRPSSCDAGVVEEFYLFDPSGSHMLVSKIKACMCNLFDGIYYSDNRSNSRANTCRRGALPVAAMIHDNSTDRTTIVPVMYHLNFCPINFRW
ncbi:unnamed protein product [Withania somnifera]